MLNTTTKTEIIPLSDLQVFATKETIKKTPKSFGKFFATAWFKHTENLTKEYVKVCLQNGWKTTRFKYPTTMLRWLISNNAPRETIETVLDMSWLHYQMLMKMDVFNDTPYSEDVVDFIFNYYQQKYKEQSSTPFDYSDIPKVRTNRYEDDF